MTLTPGADLAIVFVQIGHALSVGIAVTLQVQRPLGIGDALCTCGAVYWHNQRMTNMGNTQETAKNRPGKRLTGFGVGTAIIGALITVAILSAGGNFFGLWIVLIGLIIAGIGFAQRVLFALERR